MLKKINKLISFSKNESVDIYNKLLSLAGDIEEKTLTGRSYLLVDIEEMESLVSPDKVNTENKLEKLELEL